MDTEFLTSALFALAPTVLVGLLFWFVMRAIMRLDRSERRAFAKIEAEERAKRSQPAKDSV